MEATSDSNGILKLIQKLNKTSVADVLERGSFPFFIGNQQVGLIRPDFWQHLKSYTDVFHLVEKSPNNGDKRFGVHLSDVYQSYKERTDAVNRVMEDLRAKDALPTLRGWRDENYKAAATYSSEPLFEIERAASGIFGLLQYGVHINGYTRTPEGDIKMWIGRRSKTKQTFPDMFDNMCAGGLPAGMGVLECAKKECQEEGSVPDKLLEKLKPVGCITYFYEDERGLQPESQFVYDLELPSDFVPVNADGEMGSFQLLTMEQLQKEVLGENFKPNCAAICVDFLIRHGYCSFDSDPNILHYIEQMHAPLQSIYR